MASTPPPPEVRYSDGEDVDLEQVAALFESAGWRWRTRDRGELARLLAGSRYLACAWEGPRLVGFARAISDGVSNAYVCNVAVLPDCQGRGIGRGVMGRLLAGKPGIKFVLLAREEVKGFYRDLGFEDAVDILVRDRRPPGRPAL